MAEAEKEAADAYQGSNGRKSHLSGAVVGFTWSPEVEEAFKQLVVEQSSKLLVVVSTALCWASCSTEPPVRPLELRVRRYTLSRSRRSRPIK